MTRISENWDRGSVIGATSYVNIGKVTYHAPRGDRIVRKRLYVLGVLLAWILFLSSFFFSLDGPRTCQEGSTRVPSPTLMVRLFDDASTGRRRGSSGEFPRERGAVESDQQNTSCLPHSHTPALTPHHLRCRDRFGFCYSSHGRARCAWRNGTRRRYKKTGRGSSRR